jgi:hypothetical protein
MSLCRRLVLLVLVQRLGEVAWARRNERRLRAAGADEVGARHYPLFFLLHGSWLAVLALLVPADAPDHDWEGLRVDQHPLWGPAPRASGRSLFGGRGDGGGVLARHRHRHLWWVGRAPATQYRLPPAGC